MTVTRLSFYGHNRHNRRMLGFSPFPRPGLFIAGLVFVAGAPDAGADAEPARSPAAQAPRFLALVSDNDNYAPARQDRHYTNGLLLSFGLPKGQPSPWLDWLGRLAPLAGRVQDREYNVSLGQNLYTPEAFTSPEPIPGDRPFAGWLYGELSVTAHAPGVEERLAVNLGVVGPAAQGRRTQQLLHDISGDAAPRGWRHQLDNEPALLLRYRRSRFTRLAGSEAAGLDLVSRVGLSAGNVVTAAGAGAMLRLGSALFERDLPQRLQPGLSGNSPRFDARPGRFDWFVFAGAQGRIIAHNVFLDGNTFKDSPSVGSKPLGWDASAGLSLIFGNLPYPVMLSFTHVWRGKEFDGQEGADRFGSAQVSVRY